ENSSNPYTPHQKSLTPPSPKDFFSKPYLMEIKPLSIKASSVKNESKMKEKLPLSFSSNP
ncbi:MAG TPA: hypothetical protein DDW56_16525, partial [Cyanobacteria bacterium UBA11366]|nr:hypothetical protein [Cyanobacteria bacterium UBA11366]